MFFTDRNTLEPRAYWLASKNEEKQSFPKNKRILLMLFILIVKRYKTQVLLERIDRLLANFGRLIW